jgi:ubiquinone/menaquinone biosynthesis C-methylase UbiE
MVCAALSDQAYHPALSAKLLQLCSLQPGQTVLDLACGTGHLAMQAAAAVGPTGRVVGVDLSPAILQQATDKAAAQGISSTTTFVCGDMESLQDSQALHKTCREMRDRRVSGQDRLCRRGKGCWRAIVASQSATA